MHVFRPVAVYLAGNAASLQNNSALPLDKKRGEACLIGQRRRIWSCPLDSASTDKRIRDGLSSGDSSVLELIWDSYAEGLFAYAQALLCSRCDAEDAMQELFLRIVRNRHALAKAESVKRYLFVMLRNLAMDMLKRRGRESSLDVCEDEWLVSCDGSQDGGESKREVEAALKELPAGQREAVVLKIYEDMQFNEISEALGISQNTAASRFRYGIQKLRELLKG